MASAHLAAVNRSLKGFNDELSNDCLYASRELFDRTKPDNEKWCMNSRIQAAVELYITTEEEKYAKVLHDSEDYILDNTDSTGWMICRVLKIFSDAFKEKFRDRLKKSKADLDKKYAFKLLKVFTNNIKIKDKGLPEGFYKPDESYVFDYSHAWACTPYYSFIVATLGLNIIEPGLKKIEVKPIKTKLDFSYVIPTVYGDILINKKNDKFDIKKPECIEIMEK